MNNFIQYYTNLCNLTYPPSIRGKDRNGKEAVDQSVALIDYLRLAAVPFGEYLRGRNLSLYLIVEANVTVRVT